MRVVHDGWARGDFRVAQELFAPVFAWDQPAAAVEPGSRRGLAVRDDEVVVVARTRGTAKASRMELDQLFAYVWAVQGGLIARLRVFTDREQALEAAGLSE